MSLCFVDIHADASSYIYCELLSLCVRVSDLTLLGRTVVALAVSFTASCTCPCDRLASTQMLAVTFTASFRSRACSYIYCARLVYCLCRGACILVLLESPPLSPAPRWAPLGRYFPGALLVNASTIRKSYRVSPPAPPRSVGPLSPGQIHAT